MFHFLQMMDTLWQYYFTDSRYFMAMQNARDGDTSEMNKY